MIFWLTGLPAGIAVMDVLADVDAVCPTRANHETPVARLTVAKTAKMDVLSDIYSAVVDAAEQGRTLEEFDRELAPVLQRKGWWGRQENATDTCTMMRGIASELLSMAKDNFESESWGGQRWKQSRRAADKGGKTLQKSGQLAASLTTQVGNNYARIGSNKKYAAIHHLGGQAGRGHKTNLPARPYLPINGNNQLQPDAERRILDIAIAALKKGL